ncbi:unnamed protein product [Boreogadus saida]
MEATICNIQVLLQAAEFLERREREAEHGYASVLTPSTEDSDKRNRQKNKKLSGPGGNRLVHNELEKNRRAQLRFHLDQLKEQVPLSSDSVRNTTLNLLRRAQLHIKVRRTVGTENGVALGCSTAGSVFLHRAAPCFGTLMHTF